MNTPNSEEKIEEIAKSLVLEHSETMRAKEGLKQYGTYMYLQGIEAAKKVIPGEIGDFTVEKDDQGAIGWHMCRETTLSNLEALTDKEK